MYLRQQGQCGRAGREVAPAAAAAVRRAWLQRQHGVRHSDSAQAPRALLLNTQTRVHTRTHIQGMSTKEGVAGGASRSQQRAQWGRPLTSSRPAHTHTRHEHKKGVAGGASRGASRGPSGADPLPVVGKAQRGVRHSGQVALRQRPPQPRKAPCQLLCACVCANGGAWCVCVWPCVVGGCVRVRVAVRGGGVCGRAWWVCVCACEWRCVMGVCVRVRVAVRGGCECGVVGVSVARCAGELVPPHKQTTNCHALPPASKQKHAPGRSRASVQG